MRTSKPTRKSNVAYFQIGLIVALLLAIFLIENKTEIKTIPAETVAHHDLNDEKPFVFQMPKKKPETVLPKKEKKVSKQLPVKAKDKPNIEPPIFDSSPISPNPTKVDSIGLQNPVKDEKIEKLDFTIVEMVPVFPGCEIYETQAEIKSCFSSQITKMVQRKFDGDLAAKLNLSGEQRIYVTFTVNKLGVVENIKARSKQPELADEAKRVVKLLPKMKPGQQQSKKVAVTYSLPIIFDVQ